MCDLSEYSIVQWFDEVEKHRCGYCKSPNGSVSIGMWADKLTVEDYQNLIDRGWRRSGKYCYKPTMDETCCPQYTIKCDILNFSTSKSQKKVIKKFNRFLKDGILDKRDRSYLPENNSSIQEQVFNKDVTNIDLNEVKRMDTEDSKGADDTEMIADPKVTQCEPTLDEHEVSDPNHTQDDTDGSTDVRPNDHKPSELPSNQKHKASSTETGIDSSKVPSKKAKLIRLERKKEKLAKKGLVLEKKKVVQTQKTIEQLIEEVPEGAKKKLKLVLVSTSESSMEWESTKDFEFELYKKYQMKIHNDPPEKLSMKGFCRFLVSSPLKPIDRPDGPGFGSFHQQYWLDDKLIAVGVIDILPRCISSVYFFYDPDYRNLTLGTYGALREVYFTRHLQRTLPNLNSYYMGFYIHSCPKMRYKGRLRKSYLLCPETYHWIPIERCLELLDESKYSRLNVDLDALDENVPNERDILKMKVIYRYQLMLFKDFKRISDQAEIFHKIGELVGKKCATNMVFFVS